MAQRKQVLLRRQEANPGVLVWSGLTANARSRLDVAAAASRTTTAIPQIASFIDKQIAPLSSNDQAPAISVLDPAGLDGFKRLQRRADSAQLDLWKLLWKGTAEDREKCCHIICSRTEQRFEGVNAAVPAGAGVQSCPSYWAKALL